MIHVEITHRTEDGGTATFRGRACRLANGGVHARRVEGYPDQTVHLFYGAPSDIVRIRRQDPRYGDYTVPVEIDDLPGPAEEAS